MNSKLIEEFTKLLEYINILIKDITEPKDIKSNKFRARQITSIIKILKNFPNKITLENYKELETISGIGKHTIIRIKEILETDKLAELDEFNLTYNNKLYTKKKEIIENLQEVVGIGPNKALEFYNMGVKSINDLKKKNKQR